MKAERAHTEFLPQNVSTGWKYQSLQKSECWPLGSKKTPKTREAFCFLQNPFPFLPCESFPDKFNLPRKINKFLWCEFKTSKRHGQLILSVSKASLIKTSLIFALPQQILGWGSEEKGKNRGNALCQCRCCCPSWESAGPRLPASSWGVV